MKYKLFILCFLIWQSFFTQKFPNNKYTRYQEYNFQGVNNGIFISGSVINSNFVNGTYSYFTDAKVITPKIGLNLRIGYNKNAIMTDANYFVVEYSLPKNNALSAALKDSLAVVHRGVDVFVSYNLLSPNRRANLQQIFQPYVGLGYQMSELALTKSKDKYFGKALSSYKFNNPMWKIGIRVTPYEIISLFAEFKQSFSLDFKDFDLRNRNKFYQLNFGLIIMPSKLFKKY